MAYNGISPYLYKNSVSTVDTFDDISGSFNGSTTTFNITVGGASYTRLTAKACLIVLGGVVQEAGIDYTVNAGQITFTTAPVAGLTFEGRHLFGLNAVDTPTSGSVTPTSLSTGGPIWNTSGNVGISTSTLTSKLSVNAPIYNISEDVNNIVASTSALTIFTTDENSAVQNANGAGIRFSQRWFTGSTDVITTAAIYGYKRTGSGFFGGGLKFATSNGVNSNLSERMVIDDSGNVGIGTTNPTEKLMIGGGSIRINVGYLKMTGVATPGHEDYIQLQGNGTSYIGVGAEANPTLKFKVGDTSTTVLEVSSTNVRPGADNTYDLGSTARRWANIYSADLQLSNEGSQNDVDGTWGQYTIQEGENDLFLINRRNGKKYKFVLQEVN